MNGNADGVSAGVALSVARKGSGMCDGVTRTESTCIRVRCGWAPRHPQLHHDVSRGHRVRRGCVSLRGDCRHRQRNWKARSSLEPVITPLRGCPCFCCLARPRQSDDRFLFTVHVSMHCMLHGRAIDTVALRVEAVASSFACHVCGCPHARAVHGMTALRTAAVFGSAAS